jgi:hypothetical protein
MLLYSLYIFYVFQTAFLIYRIFSYIVTIVLYINLLTQLYFSKNLARPVPLSRSHIALVQQVF